MCCLAFVSSAGVGGVALAQTGQAPNVYYDVPTSQAQSEINTWATMYDTLKRTGQPAAGASTFAFSNAAMNTPLFSVLVAAKRTVGDVTGANPCNPLNGTPTTGGGDSLTANTLSWMTSNTVSIDLVDDPQATSSLIQAAASDPNASLSISGSTLQAANLSATAVAGAPVAASYALVNSNTLLWIEDLTAASVAHAATLNPNDNARRLLLGTPRTGDELENWVQSWGAGHGKSFGTYQIGATFGRYGELPVVVVAVGLSNSPENFYLLVDGDTGNVDGPFETGSAINASFLLAGHPESYRSGSNIGLIRSATGCEIVRADIRSPFLPAPAPGTLPPGLVPVPGVVPGKPTSWTCTGGFTLPCTCVATYNYEPGPGVACPPQLPPLSSPGLCIIKVDITCTSGGGGTGAACNGGPAAGAPIPPAVPNPGPRGVPGAPGTTTCSESWWYWS